MHFAYPDGNPTNPAAFTPRLNRTSLISSLRRRVRLRTVAYVSSFLLFVYLLFSWNVAVSGSLAYAPKEPIMTKAGKGHPQVVVVTVLDESKGYGMVQALKLNREEYAKRNGYTAFMPWVTDYNVGDAPTSWAKVPALRHAMTIYKDTPYFLYVDDHSLLANPVIRVEEDIIARDRIEKLAIRGVPVVPPDSVIKTPSEISGAEVNFVLVQDKEGLSVNSFILRNGAWAEYFLDAWFDPLYRSYNFQRAERHALEHIVQWHGTLLSKFALVPQNILSSYTLEDRGIVTREGYYKDGNFIVSFGDCEYNGRDCSSEMKPYIERFHGVTF